MISQRTAHDLWCAYDEIAKGEKLLAEMEGQLKSGENPNPRDDFGRRKNLQLGIPSSSTCHRLLDVSPDLAMVIIRAHIAEKRSKLDALNAQAKMEAESGVAA